MELRIGAKKQRRRQEHKKNIKMKRKQVPRGYIRCNYFIVTHRIIALFMMSFDDFLLSEKTIFIIRK